MKRVRVYFNLHRKLFSVQEKTSKGWRVWLHANQITLENAVFKVSEAGRQRVIREKKKNVHAFVEGSMVLHDTVEVINPTIQLSYNPYKAGVFVERGSQQPVYGARFAVLKDKQIYIQPL